MGFGGHIARARTFHPAAALLALAACSSPAPAPSSAEPTAEAARVGGATVRVEDRNLAGAHTARVDAACTLYVEPAGEDRWGGRTPADALRTPNLAAAKARPGDVVCFAAGAYPPLAIHDVHGTSAAPIVFRTLAGAQRSATFTTGSVDYGRAVSVERSEFVHLYDLRVAGAQAGVGLESSSNGRVEGLLIEDVGQAAIHVGRQVAPGSAPRFIGPASHDIDVIGNTIRRTGRAKARFGEGVYIGTGGIAGDETHDILVAYNDVQYSAAEGIEVKAYTYNVTVRGNVVAHGSHSFHAGITIGVTPRRCLDPLAAPPCTFATDYRDGNYLVEDNRVFDFSARPAAADSGHAGAVAGIGVGHGNAVVRNNVVWSIPGGSALRTYTTFGNPAARRVLFERNTAWNPAGRAIVLDDGDEGTGVGDQHAEVTVTGTVTEPVGRPGIGSPLSRPR